MLAKLNGRSTSCASFPYYYTVYYINTTSQPKGTTSLQSILIDNNGSPCHMDNLISFQRVIDRQDRTQVEGRFSYWNYTGDITTAWYTGILHRTRTRRKTTCLVGTTSIEATTPCRTPSRKTPRRRLRIDPSHRTWTFKTTPVIKTTNHRHEPPTTWQDQPNGNPFPIRSPATGLLLLLHSCTNKYLRWFLFDAKQPGNQTISMPVSWKYYRLYFEFSLYSLFLQYTPNY